MQYIQIHLSALRRLEYGTGIAVVLLADGNHRFCPIVCNVEDVANIKLRPDDYDEGDTPLLSEVVAKTYKDMGIKCEIFLGLYKVPTAVLRLNGDDEKCYEIHWVDALTLAQNDGMEMFAEAKQWQSISQYQADNIAEVGLNIPVEQMPDIALQAIIREAVKHENYESAKMMQDILNERKGNG